MLELYHGAVSTASERARFALEEKALAWTGHVVDLMSGAQHVPSYRVLNPKGQVPTLVHDGFVLRESSVIAEYLDDVFPQHPIRPRSARRLARARLWDKTIDEVHPATGVLTYAIALRPSLMQKPKADLDALVAAIADPARRAMRRNVLDHGIGAQEIKPALSIYAALLDEMETELAHSPWLAGPDFSMADIAAAPFLTRIDHLGMGEMIAARPRAHAWFGKVRTRPAYARAITAVIPAPVIANFAATGADAWPRLRSLLA